jgi:hypothetical protein
VLASGPANRDMCIVGPSGHRSPESIERCAPAFASNGVPVTRVDGGTYATFHRPAAVLGMVVDPAYRGRGSGGDLRTALGEHAMASGRPAV